MALFLIKHKATLTLHFKLNQDKSWLDCSAWSLYV